ncbi:ankyrin repeat and BTB/POZ domain-containing protein 1-like isoform X1 [Apostichopus japonicus]|uniref:ankyrin repeat and BTB/POZ domain-containing protein 1-like isoform X1 n=1 Tax=Stichopus japonicus TaxID=307972 RepID=UPI003AB26F09
MDRSDVFLCCKSGDLSRIKYLVEVKEVDVNIRDKWDSTPLYYACLCGHKELVQFLLECGAKCEAKTFDGERCLYGALTDEIRDILKSYKAVDVGHGRKNQFQEFLRQLLESGDSSDITFVIHDVYIPAHRCILHARSTYFAEMLCMKWANRSLVNIKSSVVRPEAFRALLRYIYTGYLKISLDCVDDCLRFAKQCQMASLIELINKRLDIIEKFVPQKPGTEINMLSIEPDQSDSELRNDFDQLAELAVPPNLRRLMDIHDIPFYGEVQDAPPFADICFLLEGYHFYCHQIFFRRRSDYFKALLTDHFGETEEDSMSALPVIRLHDISAKIFSKVVYYMYTDTVENLNDVSAYELLCNADLFLLPGLKKQCANEIANHFTDENVISVLQIARMFNLIKLEDQCAEFMANILSLLIGKQEFADLIVEDSQSVTKRQEIDSIPIVDDIRYHISSSVQTLSAVQEAQEKLAELDNLLQELGLDC